MSEPGLVIKLCSEAVREAATVMLLYWGVVLSFIVRQTFILLYICVTTHPVTRSCLY